MSSEVPEGWTDPPLKDLGSTYNGLAGKTKGDFGVGKPFVTYRQVFAGGAIDFAGCERVDIGPNEKQNRVQPGDVLFTTSSETLEEVAFSAVVLGETPEAYLNSFCFGLRPTSEDRLWPPFSKYLFRGPHFREAAVRLGQGSTRINISKTRLMDVALPLPPLPEQEKIAAILSAVDAAIDATRALVEQTRRVKAGLQQEVFTRGVALNGGPHSNFRVSPLGRIPVGWETCRLGQVLANPPKNGLSPPIAETGVPTFSIAAVRDGQVHIAANLKYANPGERSTKSYEICQGDILLVRGNANPELVASAGVVGDHPPGCIYPDLLMRLTPTSRVLPRFLLEAINCRQTHERLLRRAKTTNGTLKINSGDVRGVRIVLPPIEEQARIVSIFEALTDALGSLGTELDRLQQLKAGLLQDLLTGAVRVTP